MRARVNFRSATPEAAEVVRRYSRSYRASVVAVGAWTNPCGGARWRTLADGTIEIEGRGVLLPSPAVQKYLGQSWANFGPEISQASRRRKVPIPWILAIITVETGLWSGNKQKQAAISSGCCVGPMAIMVAPSPNYRTFGGYSSAQEMFEPAKNIDTGAAMIGYWTDQGYDLPMVTARYNSGGLCCPTSPDVPSKPGGRQSNPFNLCSAAIEGTSYPELAIRCQNYALALGIGAPVLAAGVWLGGALALATGAVAGFYALAQHR